MHDGDGGIVVLILQIREKRPQLPHQKHPLINDGPAGHGNHVGIVVALLENPAHDVELPVERLPFFHPFRLLHESLPDGGHTFPGLMPQHGRVGRHFPPAQKFHPFLFHDDLEHLFGLAAQQFVGREEEHPHPVFPLPAGLDAGQGADLLKEAVGNLGQDSHAVPGLSFRILSRTVLQMLHDPERIRHDPMALFAADIDHRSDPAVIVFEFRPVKALWRLTLSHLPSSCRVEELNKKGHQKPARCADS